MEEVTTRGPRRQDAAGHRQGVGLRAPAGEEHLVGVDVQRRSQTGARLGEYRSGAPSRGVLGGRVGPPAQVAAQVRGHLLGDLAAHGRSRGVIEVHAGREGC